MVANSSSSKKFLMYPRFLQIILEIQTANKHPYLPLAFTKKVFANMRRNFAGVHRPLLAAMLPAVANPADQEVQPEHAAQHVKEAQNVEEAQNVVAEEEQPQSVLKS